MSWLLSILLAVFTAVAGAFAAGAVASLYVDWYHVTSREGAAGYLVLFVALGGAMAGGVLGLVVSRVIAPGEHPFLRAGGTSLAVVLVLAGVSAGLARFLADVPPTLDGEELWLMVEVRCPAGQTASPATDPSDALVRLGALSGRTMRVRRRGVLWKEDARLVDGRWVVPGAARVFTSRGKRTLDIVLGGKEEFFLIPLPGHPGRKQLEWSDWMPRPRADGAPSPFTFTYRFRVMPVTEPIRTDAVGPFTVETLSGSVYETEGPDVGSASTFRVRHGGRAVSFAPPPGDGEPRQPTDIADAVLAVAGPRPALLVHADGEGWAGAFLVDEENGVARVRHVTDATSSQVDVSELTSDMAAFEASRKRSRPRGWLDRAALDHAGVYRVGTDAVLDTRTLAVHRFAVSGDDVPIPDVPPLGLSPDGRSLVTFAYAGGQEETPVLVVTDFVSGERYTLPVDRARMRYARLEKLDPAWLDHHFAWSRSPGGTDRLAERPGFTPLPYQGELSTEQSGYREYRLEPAGAALREALAEFLVKELHAERLPAEADAYAWPFRLGGEPFEVNHGSFGAVTVTMSREAKRDVLDGIASRFNEELRNGKYDALFVK